MKRLSISYCGLDRVVALLAAAVLSGCSTNFHSASSPYTDTTPVTAIYVYSFLDLRQGSLGPNFLAETKKQLTAALSREGIRSKQLWFNESPLREQFSLEAKGPNPANTNTRVPVGEVVEATQQDERAFGASHRLVVFPAYVMSSNTGSSFDIRWDLVNSQTNQLSWRTISRSHFQKFFLGDENPQDRASEVVQGLMSELRKAKVIRSSGA